MFIIAWRKNVYASRHIIDVRWLLLLLLATMAERLVLLYRSGFRGLSSYIGGVLVRAMKVAKMCKWRGFYPELTFTMDIDTRSNRAAPRNAARHSKIYRS